MLSQVLLKVSEVVKVLLAVFTNMHFLLGFLVSRQFLGIKVKCADVLLQGTLSCVSFTTVVTHVGLLQRAQVCFQVLFKMVVQLEAAVTLVATEHVVCLRNLDLDNLQHLGGSHRFLMIHNLMLRKNTERKKTKTKPLS